MNKLLLTLGTVLLISGCSQEPTQLEKCVAVNHQELIEGIRPHENSYKINAILSQPLVANEELANIFWKEYSMVYGGETKADFEANKRSFILYNPELSLISFLVLYPNFLKKNTTYVSNIELWWSKEPTIEELRTNMWAGRLYASSMSTSVIWPLMVYWSALEEYNLNYYLNKEANKVCNAQGIY
tara:strand:+ start:721 stop:1275 length:555 start_codon:yes stop_codon:yes gene_type:complete